MRKATYPRDGNETSFIGNKLMAMNPMKRQGTHGIKPNEKDKLATQVHYQPFYGLPLTLTIHSPIRSTAHSSNGTDRTSRSGKSPYPLPSSLFL
jgi:hypothetical protein